MKILILILTILVFIGCTEDSTTNEGTLNNPCKTGKVCNEGLICNEQTNACIVKSVTCNPVCDDWEECKDIDNEKKCILKENHCKLTSDCTDNKICENHECITPVGVCDTTCEIWEICSDNNICELKTGSCNTQSDCTDGKTCDKHYCIDKSIICEPTCKAWEECTSVNEKNECKLKEGSCETQTDCTDGKLCKSHICVEKGVGDEGEGCKVDKTCNINLFCNTNNICELEDVVHFGEEGKPCKRVGEPKCNEGLFCTSNNLCLTETDRGEEGNICKENFECNANLMCSIDEICLNQDDFNTQDEGQPCGGDDFNTCYDGLICDTFGKCELDCSAGNDSLCTENGMFNFENNYVGKYKIIKFTETTTFGSIDYETVDNGYPYFELILKNYYNFKYLGFRSCETLQCNSVIEKSYYKIVEYDGQVLMEYANENGNSCTYTSIDSKIRKTGNRVILRYTFSEYTDDNFSDNCGTSDVKNHYGEMEYTKVRLIYGERI